MAQEHYTDLVIFGAFQPIDIRLLGSTTVNRNENDDDDFAPPLDNEMDNNEIHNNEIDNNEINNNKIHNNKIHNNKIHNNEIHNDEIDNEINNEIPSAPQPLQRSP